jgi:hypothetical protein
VASLVALAEFSLSLRINLVSTPIEPATTVISFCVRVPVLSVHMTETFAMVSHDPSTRTRRFTFVIRFVAKANVTASGSPVVDK